jgi:hypothetical protein
MEYAGIARAETELFANHSMFLVQLFVTSDAWPDGVIQRMSGQLRLGSSFAISSHLAVNRVDSTAG